MTWADIGRGAITPNTAPGAVSTNLLTSLEAMQRGEDTGFPLTVARRACWVPEEAPEARFIIDPATARTLRAAPERTS